MAISRVEIKELLVFKGEFKANFCSGINVLIGGNGTGKTTLIKAMYLHFKGRRYGAYLNGEKVENLGDMVRNNIHMVTAAGLCDVVFQDSITLDFDQKPRDILFIPEKDILEHARGLLPFIDQKETGFGSIYRDVLITAQDIYTKGQSETQKMVGKIIVETIGGKTEWVPSEGMYYTVRTDGTRIPFTNEASGFKKLGYLGLLVASGYLEPGSVLFWDEPENSLNPELVPVLVDVLLRLSRNDVQIFIATHSDFLCKWFELKSNDSNGAEIKFLSLYKDNGRISAEGSQTYRSLEHNSIIEQSVKLYNKHLREATERDED